MIVCTYLQSVKKQFELYRSLGEKTIERIPENRINWQYDEDSNSIAIIVQHLWGNMLSRWTDFLQSDGEKEWRQRDAEFENMKLSKDNLEKRWKEGWDCLFQALNSLDENDLDKIVRIRGQELTVMDAINRQLAHYSYHVGQLVFLGKMVCGGKWDSLSIPKGKSSQYNQQVHKTKQKE